jgi:hypothetical protein
VRAGNGVTGFIRVEEFIEDEERKSDPQKGL